jgi:hypothetical protein
VRNNRSPSSAPLRISTLQRVGPVASSRVVTEPPVRTTDLTMRWTSFPARSTTRTITRVVAGDGGGSAEFGDNRYTGSPS